MTEYDLEEDMNSSTWFVTKVQDSRVYAQNLYAALCNMQWQRREVMPILKEQLWSCSWRAAGGVVARLRDCGEDYMDWYCSGISGGLKDVARTEGYVGEGIVTEEIEHDLGLLGWQPIPWKD